MTKEELKTDESKYIIELVIKDKLKREAEEYVKQNYCEMCVMADDCKCGCIDCYTVQAYIASAEPREKRIAELEKENADLKEEINKIAFVRGNLEEENAELKGLKDVATLIRANNDTVTTLMQLNNMLVSKNQQLTKAKDILRMIVYWKSDKKELLNFINKAEQFLNNEVEK